MGQCYLPKDTAPQSTREEGEGRNGKEGKGLPVGRQEKGQPAGRSEQVEEACQQ